MSIIKSASITSRLGRNPVFSCELQFEPEQVGKTFLIDAFYYRKTARTAQAEGPFDIYVGAEFVPNKENFEITHPLGYDIPSEYHFLQINVELKLRVGKYATTW